MEPPLQQQTVAPVVNARLTSSWEDAWRHGACHRRPRHGLTGCGEGPKNASKRHCRLRIGTAKTQRCAGQCAWVDRGLDRTCSAVRPSDVFGCAERQVSPYGCAAHLRHGPRQYGVDHGRTAPCGCTARPGGLSTSMIRQVSLQGRAFDRGRANGQSAQAPCRGLRSGRAVCARALRGRAARRYRLCGRLVAREDSPGHSAVRHRRCPRSSTAVRPVALRARAIRQVSPSGRSFSVRDAFPQCALPDFRVFWTLRVRRAPGSARASAPDDVRCAGPRPPSSP